jgi:hypothetical protein
MQTYLVTCRGDLARGVVNQLDKKGQYRHAEREVGFSAGEGVQRHHLEIDAGSAADAILIARGAVAVAGGSASDYQVEDAPEPA